MLANLPDPRRALAMWVLERLTPADAITLATTALQLGCAAKSIAIVAGMTGATRAEIEDQLPIVLRELGLRRPTLREALKVLVDEQATLIASETVSPYQRAHAIWGLLGYGRDPDDDPELSAQLRPFVELVRDCESSDELTEGAAAMITAEAQQLMDRGGLQIVRDHE